MWANNPTYSAGCKGGITVCCMFGDLIKLLFQNTKYKKVWKYISVATCHASVQEALDSIP